jgi:hypothetical protein
MMRYHILKYRNLAIIISAIMVMSIIGYGVAYGQKRTRPRLNPAPTIAPRPVKRPVNIALKKGDEISGNFLRADT